MNRQKTILLTSVLALVAATALVCVHFKQNRKLGSPGLKIAQLPVFDPKGNLVGTNTVALPERVLDFRSEVLPVSLEELSWLPADTTYAKRLYRSSDQFNLFMSVVMMGVDSRSIHKPEICLPGQGWKIERSEPSTISIDRPVPYELPIMKITASKEMQMADGRKQKFSSIYVYWFVADKHITARHDQRMWLMAKEMVTSGTLQRWSYVACLSHCLPSQEEATFDRMKEFIAASVPEFQISVGATKPGNLAIKN